MVGRRATALAALAIAWIALVAPAAAQGSSDDAEREYRLGYKALQAGDCATALVHYRRSFELTPRPRTLFNMAACEEELGLGADAWRSYHAFLELAEARDAKIVVKARARLAALTATLRGRIRVDSVPPGASVHVDGERQARAVTPVTLELEPGAHTIRVAMTDAVPIERVVDLAPDAVETVAVTLQLPATIAVVVEPDDATIAPDGGGAATVGRYEAPAAPGRHAFQVRRDGYLTERIEIEVVEGRSHVERVRLRPVPSMAALAVTGVADTTVVESEATRVSAGRRSLAWGLGGLGAAGIVGGGAVGVLALRDVAGPPEDHERGKRRAWLADGLIVAGTVAVVAAWRLLRDRSRPPAISRTRGER